MTVFIIVVMALATLIAVATLVWVFADIISELSAKERAEDEELAETEATDQDASEASNQEASDQDASNQVD